MKKLILLFGICLVLFNCNNDDDQPEPQEPDLSFPECLLSNDIYEYQLIMSNAFYPAWRSKLFKKKLKHNFKYYYSFHIVIPGIDSDNLNYNYYTENCEIFCTRLADGTSDCPAGFFDPRNVENIGAVWTDPR